MQNKLTYQQLEDKIAQLEHELVCAKIARDVQQDEHHMLQTLVDTIPSPIFYKDCSGAYQHCNESFAKLNPAKGENLVRSRASYSSRIS